MLRERALFGDDFKPKSEAGNWLLQCRQTRAYIAWIRPHAYARYILTDQLKAQQRKLAGIRAKRRGTAL